jgi:eukaryotic-like serine/threonine-protein kinase
MTMPQLTAGVLIASKYRLDARLDAGKRAEVWSATDTELQRSVAIKILLTPAGGDPGFLDAFRAEAQLDAQLRHPNIVEVFEWGTDGDANFSVMELLEGETVRRLLAIGPLAADRVIGIGRQVASALAFAHGEGVAHGSISAAHVIVGSDNRTTLIDFGLQCRGQCEYPAIADSDTAALGALLYEMLTGVKPTGPRPAGVAENAPWPEHPRKLRSDVPSALDAVVMKAIAPNPAERYATAAELQAALDELVRPKSRAWLWIMLAILAVIAAAAGAWFFSTQMKIVVPDVTGKPSAEAQATITSAGLKMVVIGQIASDSIAEGSVVSENPTAGVKVRRGSQLGVTLSSGKPTASVPAVVGLELSAASSAITGAGLKVGQVTDQANSTFPANTVISETPVAGTHVTAGTAVNLLVSSGQAKVTVPDVRGTSQTDATTKLQGLGLVVDVGQAYSSQSKGVVFAQGPAPGTSVAKGSTVSLSVSKGKAPVTVPDVIGAQAADAKTSIQNLGLVPVSELTSGTVSQVGTVISQNPDSGTKVPPGSQVKLTIGK